jgi:hypothetical protein
MNCKFCLNGLNLFIIVFLIFCSADVGSATAQTEELIIAIDRPSEGEHLYAGPKTLLYSIPIAGWVYSSDFNHSQISLTLQIYQGDEVLVETPLRLDSDNLFSIHATVNPESTFDPFAPLHGVNCDACHHGGTIDLAPGNLKIRVIAKDPTGREAVAERNIVVDLSSYTNIPVQLEYIGDSELNFQGIPITASTRLYMWRTRHSTSSADPLGFTMIEVEALSETQTRYLIKVEPIKINGVIYESVSPAEVILSPEALHIAPITLQVMAHLGEIHGQLMTDGELPQKILAIDPSSGASYEADIASEGGFDFIGLPFSEYILSLDCDDLQIGRQSCILKSVVLSEAAIPDVLFSIEPEEYKRVSLEFRSEDGHPVPFVWVEAEGGVHSVTANPYSGHASLYLPDIQDTVQITFLSPGSETQTREFTSSEFDSTIEIQLETAMDTRSLPWGKGFIFLPPETQALEVEDRIRFTAGWMWGQGEDTLPLIIETPEGEITIERGRFALEKIPNLDSWFFLMEGEAEVILDDGREWSMQDGEMLSLAKENFHGPVPMNDIALSAIRPNEPPSNLLELGEPEIQASTTINGAQIVQIITLILILGFILLLFYPWIRRVQSWAMDFFGSRKSGEIESQDDL